MGHRYRHQIGNHPHRRPGPVDSVAISPDGKTLARGGADDVRLWDVATAADRLPSPADPGGVGLGDVRPTARPWPRRRRRLRPVVGRGHRPQIGGASPAAAAQVGSVAFSPDGKTLAASRADHTVRLWDVAYLVNVVPRLCASAGRSLTTRRVGTIRASPGLPEGLPVTAQSPAAPTARPRRGVITVALGANNADSVSDGIVDSAAVWPTVTAALRAVLKSSTRRPPYGTPGYSPADSPVCLCIAALGLKIRFCRRAGTSAPRSDLT